MINSIDSERLILKWPNDILIGDRKLCGILVEGKTSQDSTKVVLGIGVNLETSDKMIDGREISTLQEIIDIDFHHLDRRLNSELASLIEERHDLPPVNFESIRGKILNHMKSLGKPVHSGITHDNFKLNNRGELVLDGTIINDGEDIYWI